MSLGLRVTANQTSYPFQLSSNELLTHKLFLEDYKEEISTSFYESALIYKPDLSLIYQQPELKPYLRTSFLEFLLKICIRTKVTNGIFHQSVRVFDRYCSKRIVLKDQVQLVLVTCLWLSAKTYGGCNHIINNTNVPTGGRFHGPNPRSRIPRLSELAQLCGTNCDHSLIFDENMIIQMERHILNTLNWDVTEPQLSNWLFNFYENNLIQFEEMTTMCLESQDPMTDEFQSKCDIINLKKFLSEMVLFEHKLIELHPSQLAQLIINIINNYYNTSFESDLIIPSTLTAEQSQYYQNLILDKILSTSESVLNYYFTTSPSIKHFYTQVVTTMIKSDTTLASTPQSIYTTPSKSTGSYTNVNSPMSIMNSNSPMKKPCLSTPPSSRRGSPAGMGVLDPTKMKMKMMKGHNAGGVTPPLTPVDKL